ncbi:two-component system response regulator [Sphingomonas oleivorans]|uniref:Two-component system response regulator n=2 Tax=Sphingomonas oleivorans TaxID=1735121 RepID=A0A2T5FWY1_9SPHN|nr:two-component system response regulator [Sphingomonas oleivorans]
MVIAIVDDDKAVLDAMSSFIRSLGYRVRTFQSGKAFLDHEGIGEIACLFTDIQMPGLSGFELHDIVRLNRPAIPVVLMTALADASVRARALSSGARCFLEKPIAGREIMNCLSGIFDA